MLVLLKRWGLFLTVNFLILTVVGAIMQFFRISTDQWLTLLLFCAAFGFFGAVISLFTSKAIAKATYRLLS